MPVQPPCAHGAPHQSCTHNPLGAKGCGEAGSIGAPAAVVSAALAALAGLGVTDLEMPLTPEQIWRRVGETGEGGARLKRA
jgi:aerobic carbon-monoxide dehydrogenase large subunit